MTREEIMDAIVLYDRHTTILVWQWEHAPDALRSLSPHGGDEDWVAFIPTGLARPAWTEEGSSFGCCCVSETETPKGLVLIGAHA